MGTRTLFEFLIALHDVVASPAVDERYRDHEWIVREQEAKLDRELPYLRRKERSSLQHRQTKILRDEADHVGEATTKYGDPFGRGWASEDLQPVRIDTVSVMSTRTSDLFPPCSTALQGASLESENLTATRASIDWVPPSLYVRGRSCTGRGSSSA